MKKLLMILLVATLAAGCTTDEYFQKVTAPMTKCNTSNLQITDINRDKPTSWRAICRSDGRIYQCTKSECNEVK